VRVLIVKTTSMGDVVHALPAVSDLLRERPGTVVDWLVEAPFAAIPRLHPGVSRVLPLAWRRWRRQLARRETWAQIAALRDELRAQEYAMVIDLQGLLKSALWGLQAHGPLMGYDSRSLREPLASLFYSRRVDVLRSLPAVERCRRLVAALAGYAPPPSPPDFGIVAPLPSWSPAGRYAVLVPAASRPEKLWPEADWIAVGRRLADDGLEPVVLWGSPVERARADRIAQACGGAVPPFLSVADAAGVLAGATRIVGLDTGFSHLGAAFGVPTVGIYCDHDPGLAGITGPGPVASIGGKGQVPAMDAVLSLIASQAVAWS
jgi:heptosyltransferase-1